MENIEKIKEEIKELKAEVANNKNLAELLIETLNKAQNSLFANVMQTNEKIKLLDSLKDVNGILLTNEQKFSQLYADLRRTIENSERQYLQIIDVLKTNNKMLRDWTLKVDAKFKEIDRKLAGNKLGRPIKTK